MIAKLVHPVSVSTLGAVLSIALGVALSFRVAQPLLEKAVVVVEEKMPEELAQRGWDFWTIEIDNLAHELKDERARLRKQAELNEQRTARLAAEEKELAKVRAELERLRKEIADKVVEITADEAKNIRSLAQAYGNLTPRAAVAILKEMEETTAVKVLSQMKAETVGPIFEEMAKSTGADGNLARRAAALSERLRLMKANKAAASL